MTNLLPMMLDISLYWLILGIMGSWVLYCWGKGLAFFFLLNTLGSLALLVLSILAFKQPTFTLIVTLGIPGFPFYFHCDGLSAFFLILLSTANLGIGLFASQYFRSLETRLQSLLCFQIHLFLVSMVWVFLAADVYSFLIAWELMTFSSYFLIVAFVPTSETRHAGFLYFLMAHLSALMILFGFSIILFTQSGFTFDAMRHASLTPMYTSLAFLLTLLGFGAKAGLLPLHVWLPEAHPAAPSPISALMSGVMLKTAIYGIIRVSFDFLHLQGMAWGLFILTLGLLTALLGIIFAAMQTDMKRLLAYSSIENMGIITMGLGLALLFNASHQVALAALALSIALFHCFNHAMFKSLLFLGTGSVLHATGERNLGQLGGLILRMPRVATLMLLGTLAIAGVPPLNGFVSEWLLLQAFLFFPKIPTPYITMLMPVAAAAFALTIGLTAYVMVKFYGIIFLGKPREAKLAQAKDASLWECAGLGWLALACLLLGLFPILLLHPLRQLAASLLGQPALSLHQSSWLFLIPVSAERASYSPLLFFCGILGLSTLLYGIIRKLYHGKIRRAAAWDCGFPAQTSRMQDTAEGFTQPIKHIFSPLLNIPGDTTKTGDRFWHILYLPLIQVTQWIAKNLTKLQQGRISHYLLYSFLTLIVLLWWVS